MPNDSRAWLRVCNFFPTAFILAFQDLWSFHFFETFFFLKKKGGVYRFFATVHGSSPVGQGTCRLAAKAKPLQATVDIQFMTAAMYMHNTYFQPVNFTLGVKSLVPNLRLQSDSTLGAKDEVDHPNWEHSRSLHASAARSRIHFHGPGQFCKERRQTRSSLIVLRSSLGR